MTAGPHVRRRRFASARFREPASGRAGALQECCTHILARIDQSKDDTDRYYHAFLQLEDVVSQTVNSQNELIKNVRALRCPREITIIPLENIGSCAIMCSVTSTFFIMRRTYV